MKRYSILFSGYRQLSLNMGSITEDIAEASGVSPEIEREVNRVRARYRTLAVEDDPKPSTELVLKLQHDVNERIPVGSLFYPTATKIPHQQTFGDEGLTDGIEALDARIDPVESWPTGAPNRAHE